MIIPKATARWTSRLSNQSARTARSTRHSRSWQQAQKRAYASEGGGHAGNTQSRFAGDLPWATAATFVTLPSLWYLMQPQIERFNRPKGSGHGGHGHDEHGEEPEGGEETEAHEGEDSGEKGGDEGAEGQDESKEGGDESEQSDDSGSEEGENDTPDTSGDEEKVVDSGENVEGVQFKGSSNAGPNKQQSDTRKHIPDAKGGAKKRIESHYGQRQGVAGDSEQDPKDKDLGASSKAVDDPSKTSTAGKQEGLSNTDTKHSEDITNSSGKSTKGEGTVETAKLKGTVSPNRPQAENKEARDS